MKRDIVQLAAEEYDVIIVGAGIYGACAAREASLRGLKVAILDKGDFGSATSQNSLKIIHGGLRYLQQADIIRMRESVRERRTLMKIAPQFVHPLPCVMPTYGHLTKGREALFVAMLLNDIISFDRNRLEDPEKFLPRGRVISRERMLRMTPGIPDRGLTGGALWYDCQTHNSERLLLSFLLSANDAGARVTNYVEVTGFVTSGRRVTGIEALDKLSGERCKIRARLVLNAAGPWVNKVLGLLGDDRVKVPLRLSTAMNLISRKFIDGHAAGLQSQPDLIEENALIRKGSRLYFIAPWRHVSIVGTAHEPYEGDPDDYRVKEKEIADLLSEINRAYPAAGLKREDVRHCYGGLLPMKGVNRKTGDVNLLKHYSIVDHGRRDDREGLISILGVKFTTARDVAARAIDLIVKKLGIPTSRSRSDEIPIFGGDIVRFNDFLAGALRSKPDTISRESMTHLVYHYGSRYGDLINHTADAPPLSLPLPGQSFVIGAEVIHAVRREMAVRLADVIFRRTELGSAGPPGGDCLSACAGIMAKELGWDDARKKREIEEVEAEYRPTD